MWKIQKHVVDSIVQAAQHTYPNEFAALLGAKAKTQTIHELVLVPTVFGNEHAILRMDLLPWNAQTVGSVHSHPDFSNKPSIQDKQLFGSHGEIHFIICLPFSPTALTAFSSKAKPIEYQVIP